jgi:[1-hydroxy-2-(trimethylamino)ethyl]phosphonate dioxygenase
MGDQEVSPTITTARQSPHQPITQQIVALFNERGSSQYGSEAVTQLQHGLQAAALATAAGAGPTLIAAALLHDVGHLLHDLPEDAPDHGIDDRHEVLGQKWLEQHFAPSVTEPVRLHVDAKRYLCAVEPGYLAKLSEPSRQSLALQGGPMSESEAAEFRALPHAEDAVRLRWWDDLAKDPHKQTPPVEAFADVIDEALLAR